MDKTPEQRATEAFQSQQADHAAAKVIALETVQELQPVGFGEVERAITAHGISEHIAAQAIHSITRRSIDTTSVGKLVVKN